MSAQRSPLPRVAGHAAALLAGAGLALVSVRAMPREHAAGERATVNRTEAASAAFATSNLSSREPTPPNRAAAFRQAWKNLLEKPLAADDKRRLQHLLLEEWAEVDLDGALDAVAEFMRSEDGQYIPMFNLYSSLFDAFQTKMKKDPEMFWPAIRDGRFGMITGQLRNTWIRNVGDAQPEVLLSHFDDLSPVAREKSLQACLGQFVRKPELKKNVVSQLAGLPDTPDNRALWDTAGQAISDEDPAELAAQLADGASEGERRMLLAGFAASLGGSTQSSAEIRQSLDRLPDAMKQDAVVAILGQGYGDSSRTDAGVWRELRLFSSVRRDGPARFFGSCSIVPRGPQECRVFDEDDARDVGAPWPTADWGDRRLQNRLGASTTHPTESAGIPSCRRAPSHGARDEESQRCRIKRLR